MSVPERFLNGEKYLLQIKIDRLMHNKTDKSLKVRLKLSLKKRNCTRIN